MNPVPGAWRRSCTARTRAIPMCFSYRRPAAVRRAPSKRRCSFSNRRPRLTSTGPRPRSGPPKFWPRTPSGWARRCKHAAAALDRAEEEDEFLEALAAQGRARDRCGQADGGPQDPGGVAASASRCGIAIRPRAGFSPICSSRLAMWTRPHSVFQALVDADDRDADAWHGLGLCA